MYVTTISNIGYVNVFIIQTDTPYSSFYFEDMRLNYDALAHILD
jgi:hypothetical protein